MRKRKYVPLIPQGHSQGLFCVEHPSLQQAIPESGALGAAEHSRQPPKEGADAPQAPEIEPPNSGAISQWTPDDDACCPVPTIHNIVSTSMVESDAPIDLAALALLLPFSFFDRQRFAAITIRLKAPDCTTLLFSSGKVVVTGGRDTHECVLASLCVCRILRDAFPSREFRLINCDVQNIVAHVELPVGANGMLDLQSMYGKLELNCLYQRQMFPGLVWRAPASPVVLLCFYSGKVVITGGKTTRDVYDGWRKLWPTVKVFVRERN